MHKTFLLDCPMCLKVTWKSSDGEHSCAKTGDSIKYIQFSASPSQTPGSIENITFVHFMEKSMYLKSEFLSDQKVE